MAQALKHRTLVGFHFYPRCCSPGPHCYAGSSQVQVCSVHVRCNAGYGSSFGGVFCAQMLKPISCLSHVQDLCRALEQQLQGSVWLPASLFPALTSSSSSSSSSSNNKGQQGSTNRSTAISDSSSSSSSCLVYQAVVDRQGEVLGVKPCNTLAAEHFAEVPLTAALRGPALKAAQER